MARVLALDIGTSSVRAALAEEDGTLGAVAQVEYPPGPELDADALRDAVEEASGQSRRVELVAVSCFWHSLLALDERGRPLTRVSTWLDRRSERQAAELRATLDEPAVHARTGCRLHPTYWPAKLARLREEQPAVFARAARFVSFSDYLRGGSETSVSIASGTGLLDLERRAWDGELLGALDLDEARLPSIADVPDWGDGACANVGAGCVTPDRACLTIGTSAALRVVACNTVLLAKHEPSLFRYLLDEECLVTGGALSDGGNLYAWLERTLRFERPRLAAREPGAHGLTFLPQLGGERSPGWSVDGRGAITGLSLATTAADVVHAALEGIAYRLAEVAAALPDVREVVATGGALQDDDDWEQVLADVLERPVSIAGGVEEASLRGAAVLGHSRLGVEVPAPEVTRTIEPRPERFAAHREARERQRALYDALT